MAMFLRRSPARFAGDNTDTNNNTNCGNANINTNCGILWGVGDLTADAQHPDRYALMARNRELEDRVKKLSQEKDILQFHLELKDPVRSDLGVK